jgi:hypothetical protein
VVLIRPAAYDPAKTKVYKKHWMSLKQPVIWHEFIETDWDRPTGQFYGFWDYGIRGRANVYHRNASPFRPVQFRNESLHRYATVDGQKANALLGGIFSIEFASFLRFH